MSNSGHRTLDDATRENWEKIRAHLEKVGATENWFFKRAVNITSGGSDPMDHPPLGDGENPQ